MTRLLLVDHNDSFTQNVFAWLEDSGFDVVSAASTLEVEPFDGLVLGPGPGRPEDWPESMQLLARWGKRPLLGICLGCQMIATHFGATLTMGRPCHGEAVRMTHKGIGILQGIEERVRVGRYNSLGLGELPPPLEVWGWDSEGHPLALGVEGRPWYGLLFHPDSFLSDNTSRIVENIFSSLL